MFCIVSSDLFLRYEIQVAACRYYEQGRHLTATSADFINWAQSLPAKRRAICMAAGFQAANQNISFRRYLLELHGFSLYDYMGTHLSLAAMRHWQQGCPIQEAALNPNRE